jgi:hypothetical protein
MCEPLSKVLLLSVCPVGNVLTHDRQSSFVHPFSCFREAVHRTAVVENAEQARGQRNWPAASRDIAATKCVSCRWQRPTSFDGPFGQPDGALPRDAQTALRREVGDPGSFSASRTAPPATDVPPSTARCHAGTGLQPLCAETQRRSRPWLGQPMRHSHEPMFSFLFSLSISSH